MRFKGQLLVPSESGPGLRVDLEVAGHHLAVESESGDLGAWPLEAVRVRRLEGDTFEMTVAGEDLHFIADDTISFAYSGMPAIEQFSGPFPSRSRIRNFFAKLGTTSSRAQPSVREVDVVEDVPIVPSPAARDVEEDGRWEATPNEIADSPPDEVIDMDAFFAEDFQVATPPVLTPVPAPTPAAEEITPEPTGPETAEQQEMACPAFTSDGLPCRSPILAPSGYCYSHDPERSVEDGYRKAQEARARLRRKGAARLNKVYNRLDKAMREVERGELDPEVAMAMAQIARTMCAILDLDEESPEAGPSQDQSGSRM